MDYHDSSGRELRKRKMRMTFRGEGKSKGWERITMGKRKDEMTEFFMERKDARRKKMDGCRRIS